MSFTINSIVGSIVGKRPDQVTAMDKVNAATVAVTAPVWVPIVAPVMAFGAIFGCGTSKSVTGVGDAGPLQVEQPDSAASDPDAVASTDGPPPLEVNDAGQPIITGNFTMPIEGQGSHFMQTPDITLATPTPIRGTGLKNLNLAIVLGLNSTGTDMPAEMICVDGLPSVDKVDPNDPGASEYACQEPGLTSFLHCPTDPNYRLNVYLAEYTVHYFQQVGGVRREISNETKILTNIDNLHNGNPDNVTPLGPTCDADPAVTSLPYNVNIPKIAIADDSLDVELSFKLIIDTRLISKEPGEDQDLKQANYKSILTGTVTTVPIPADGGQ